MPITRSCPWLLLLAMTLTVPPAVCADEVAVPPAPTPMKATAPAPTAADLAAIDALLARMTGAVVTGDTGAYLACVVPAQGAHADATFRTEQEAWCTDWKQHPPERFVFERAPDDEPAPAKDAPEQGPERESIAPARFAARATAQGVDVRVRTTWKLPAWARERSLVFPARFVRAGGGWLYAGEVWDVLALPPGEPAGFAGARIMHEPGDELLARAARDVAKDFAAVRASVDAHFGVRLTHAQDVKLYASMRHLQHSIWLSYTDGLSGWNEPGESIKLLVGARTAGRTGGVLAHEYGHVASFALGPKATLAPWWALEGCADLASEPFRPGAARRRADRVALWASHDQLAPWDAITPFPIKPEHAQYGAHVYTQGEHMLAHIRERFGQAGYVAFLTRLCQGDDTDTASRRALGQPWAQVDGDWRDAIAAQLRQRTGRPEPDDEP